MATQSASPDPALLVAQGAVSTPLSGIFDQVTAPISPPRQTSDGVANFPPELYDLTAESNLTKLLKVILGDGGAGRLRKLFLDSRLEQQLLTTSFLSLDTYGAGLFGVRRMQGETYDSQAGDLADAMTWRAVADADGTYRSRIDQFLKAIPLGGTVLGMLTAAHAVLGVECRIYESWRLLDQGTSLGGVPGSFSPRTYGQVHDYFGTYGNMDGHTYGDIEGGVGSVGRTITSDRQEFTIRPLRALTGSETYELMRVLDRLKPAEALLTIDSDGAEVHQQVRARGASADSSYWTITTRVAPKPGTEAAYGAVGAPGEAVEQPRPPYTAYQGEAWSYSGDVASTTSYVLRDDGAESSPDFQRLATYGPGSSVAATVFTDYTPDKALADPLTVMQGRAVSDGVLVTTPVNTHPTSSASLRTTTESAA